MQYLGNGEIEFLGCNQPKIYYFVDNIYSIGDLLYIKPKALLGILEKIVIKDILANGEYPYYITYIDTYNWIWNEEELISLETAQNLIEIYKEKNKNLNLQNIKNCK
mgnify:CR=1 FL=1